MISRQVSAFLSSAVVFLSAMAFELRADVCVNTPGPTVCVGWNQPGEPSEDTDFQLDLGNPQAPGVTIFASGVWDIYTILPGQPGVGDLGDIIVNQQEGNPTVEIRLAKPDGTPAAHNVSSIREASPAGHYVNILPGSHITGSVLGNIDIQRLNPLTGTGQLHLVVDGSIYGNVSCKTVRHLQTNGALVGLLTAEEIKPVDTELDFGVRLGWLEGSISVDRLDAGSSHLAAVIIEGSVSPSSFISIGQLAGSCSITRPPIIDIGAADGNMDGSLYLGTGILCPLHKVLIHQEMNGVIKLNNHPVLGVLEIVGGGSGDVEDVLFVSRVPTIPAITGRVILGSRGDAVYSGKLNMFNLHCGQEGLCGEIHAHTLDGEIVLKDSLRGEVIIGRMTDMARVVVGESLEGNLLIAGPSSGDVVVEGKCQPGSRVEVGSLTGKARILMHKGLQGELVIKQGTAPRSIMDLESIASSGRLVINDGEGQFDAAGMIRVGPDRAYPIPPVVFDGSIMVKRGQLGGGQLTGAIEVFGCHATADPLDICLCAPGPGRVAIIQDGCPNRVTAHCESGCNN